MIRQTLDEVTSTHDDALKQSELLSEKAYNSSKTFDFGVEAIRKISSKFLA